MGGANPIVTDPNNPALAFSVNSPGKRVFLSVNYSRQYFGFGGTTFSVFYDGHTNGNTSYVFSGDANGDTVSGNDPCSLRPTRYVGDEFQVANHRRPDVHPANQAAAFEQLIQADNYLEVAPRSVCRTERCIPANRQTGSTWRSCRTSSTACGRQRHSGQIRFEVINCGNALNSDWGAGRRLVNTQILTAPSADATGRLTYNLQTLSGNLITTPIQTSAGIADVYTMMLSFRYTFQ